MIENIGSESRHPLSSILYPLSPDEVLDLLSWLVDKSLVLMQEQRGEVRYRLLETIRQYAEQKLRASGEVAAIGRQHANFFLALAEGAEPKLTSGERSVWLRRLEAERDNLRAALAWSRESVEAEMGLRLAGALKWFWYCSPA